MYLPSFPQLPGKTEAHNSELLWIMVASSFGLLGLPGIRLTVFLVRCQHHMPPSSGCRWHFPLKSLPEGFLFLESQVAEKNQPL